MRFVPTRAFVRAIVLAVAAAVAAIMGGSPAMMVLAAPFLLLSVIGMVRRPRGDDAVAVTVSAQRLVRGEAFAIRAMSAVPSRVVDIALPVSRGADIEPRGAAACAPDSVELRLRPHRWGRWDVPTVDVGLSDALGLWESRTSHDGGSVFVSPSTTLPGRGDAIPHPTGMAGAHPSPRPGEGSTLADIRLFRPGDRLRRINWRVSSRTGQLHTNATTAERDTEVVLVLDTRVDVTTTGMPGVSFASSLDATVVAAASLAEHYLRLGDRVAVHDLGQMLGDLPARSGIRQASVLAARLGTAERDRPPTGVLRPVRRVRPGSFVVVCSPLLDDAVIDEIARLTRRAAVLVVDTLPEALGTLPRTGADRQSLLARVVTPRDAGALWAEAWVLRRLVRSERVHAMSHLGVPVAPWRGVDGVAALAAQLARQRPSSAGRRS